MTRRLLFILLFLTFIIPCKAEQADMLLVTCINGDKAEISLHDSPIVVLKADSLVIKTSKLSSAFEMSNISMLQYVSSDDIISSIDKLSMGNHQWISLNDKLITIHGKINESIHIYTATGSLFSSYIIGESGEIYITTSDLPAGIYIISASKKSLKIKVK